MARLRLPARRRVLIALMLIFALLIFLPLRLALGAVGEGFSARGAGGTIWSGRVEQARLGAIEVGTLDVSLNPLPLFLGRARFQFASLPGATPQLSGAVERSRHRLALIDVNGAVIGGGLPGLAFEQLQFEQANLLISDGQCRSATGRVQLTPALAIPGLNLRNGLAGPLRCDGADVAVLLTGDSGMERLSLRIKGDGRYEARLGIATSDPLLRAALPLAGFQATAEGYATRIEGRF